MPKADPFAQHRLLDLAGLDRSLAAAAHRRATLPELADISADQQRLSELSSRQLLAQTDIDDLDGRMRRLDAEIDAVRTRAARNAARLAAGTGPAKELENLQHEIVSLGRRQGVLEDESLELMEQRETADAAVAALQHETSELTARLAALTARRDEVFSELTTSVQRDEQDRAALVEHLPTDLVALYERIHRNGRVAAAPLRGSRCEACRIDLDKVEVNALRTAAVDEVMRCSECGAILIRT